MNNKENERITTIRKITDINENTGSNDSIYIKENAESNENKRTNLAPRTKRTEKRGGQREHITNTTTRENIIYADTREKNANITHLIEIRQTTTISA